MPAHPHNDNVYEHEQKLIAILNFLGNVGGEVERKEVEST